MSFTSFSPLFKSSGERKSASSPQRRKKDSAGWGIFAFLPDLCQERFLVASDEIRVIVRYLFSGSQDLLSDKEVSIVEIILIQWSISAHNIPQPVIRPREPLIEPFFYLVFFHITSFFRVRHRRPRVAGILISCAPVSLFSDDCGKACREKIRSCGKQEEDFFTSNQPLQGAALRNHPGNNFLCGKK